MLVKKVLGSVFLCLHLTTILVVYFDFAWLEYLPEALDGDPLSIVVMGLFHLISAFQLTTIIQLVLSSPGSVPRYWVSST